MATDLERLVVQLEANMRGYERSMQRAVGKTNQTARRMENRFERANRSITRGFQVMGRTAVGALGAIGVAVGAGAFARLTMDALEAAESINDTALRVGFAAEQLQELRFAADQNGSSARTLDMALQRFSRRVGEAANGTGELRDSLIETGIELRNSDGTMRSSHEILLDYADAIQNAESDQRALGLAFKAFDSEGASLVTLMRQGSEGVREFAERAREAGVVLDEGLVRQGAEANAKIRALRQSVGAQFTQMVVENAEEIQQLAEALAGMAGAALDAASGMVTFFKSLDGGESVEDMQETMRRNSEMIERLGSRGDPNAVQRRDNLIAQNQRISERIDRVAQRERDLAALEAEIEARRVTLGAPGSSGGTGGGGARTDLLGRDVNRDITVAASVREEAEAKAQERAAAARMAKLRSGEVADAERRARDEAKAFEQARLEEFQRRREDFARGFGLTFANGVRSAFEGGLGDFIQRQLSNAAFNALASAAEAAGRALFDALSGGGGGLAGLVSGAFTTGKAPVFGGARAGGGPVEAGRSFLVGERGPELFVPKLDGAIIPNGGPGGARSVNIAMGGIHVDARGATPDAVAQLQQALPQAFQEQSRRIMQQVRAEVPGIVVRAQEDGVI